MRKLRTLVFMQWSTLVQYRADMLLWTLGEAITPLVTLAVWYTVAQSNSGGLTTQETLTYYIFVMFVSVTTNAWNGFFFSREILSGEIIKFLVKPLSVFWRHIIENIVEKSFKLFIPLLGLFFVMYYSPHIFVADIYMPRNYLLFLVSVCLAAVISFALDMSLGALAFWIEDSNELRSYRYMLESLTSGLLIPFALMPPVLFSLFSFLPFRYIISAPIEILMGQASANSTLYLIAFQIIWVIALIALLNFLWKRGLKRYAIPGQ